MCAIFKNVLFGRPETSAQYRVRLFLIITLFLLGIGHLIAFFHAGKLALVAYDWVKEDAYLNTLREAQTTGVIPWKWNENFYHDTNKFLANPEVIFTPDIVLLRWTSNSLFVLLHLILLYSIGFSGCLLIARRVKASFVSFLIFWLVFNFNGFLTAHLAVGHLQWAGYYLLPFFFLILSSFLADSQREPSKATPSALVMSLLLGVLFWNGSLHIAIWCSLFMSIALFWNWSLVKNVVSAIIMGGLIGLGRLLPAAIWFPHQSSFLSGYPDLGTLITAFTCVRECEFKHLGGAFGALGWWEYDVYIGFFALIFLVVGFAVALRRGKASSEVPILAAAGVMLLFSLGDAYALIANSHLPFAGVERVSSRFIVMPFLVFLITAIQGIDELFLSWSSKTKLAVLMGVPFATFELGLHSFSWRVWQLENSFQQTIKPVLSIAPNSDGKYAFIIYASWAVSLVALLLVVTHLFRREKQCKGSQA